MANQPISPAARAFGERVRARRQELSKSQEQLAEDRGLHWTDEARSVGRSDGVADRVGQRLVVGVREEEGSWEGQEAGAAGV